MHCIDNIEARFMGRCLMLRQGFSAGLSPALRRHRAFAVLCILPGKQKRRSLPAQVGCHQCTPCVSSQV